MKCTVAHVILCSCSQLRKETLKLIPSRGKTASKYLGKTKIKLNVEINCINLLQGQTFDVLTHEVLLAVIAA